MDKLVQERQERFRQNLLKSFGAQPIEKEEIDEDKLEKGVLSYQITSSTSFVITKSGKLIKEKLTNIKEVANQKLLECQSKYQTIRSKISEEPLQETSDYDTIMNLRIQPIPKTYSWEQISPSDKSSYYSGDSISPLKNYTTQASEPTVVSTSDLMRQYNDCVYQYSSYKKDIAMINTMLENFQDSKNYDLSVEQATIFGF